MIEIIYRCCELETGNLPKKSARPNWFSKEQSLLNIIDIANRSSHSSKFTMIHDGPSGPLEDIFKENCSGQLININYNSNHKSLIECLNYAKSSKADYIYFLEDDYIHRDGAIECLFDGLSLFPNSVISLYDHPDRYERTDDLDRGKSYIYTGKTCHWRTAESTTCTWASSKYLYDNVLYDIAKQHCLNDRDFFRNLIVGPNIRLVTPMPAYSTHCHLPFLSPLVDWEQ